MTPDRDWTDSFGLSNPAHNGSVDPRWMEDAIWFLCVRAREAASQSDVDGLKVALAALQANGCAKYQRIRWLTIGAIIFAGASAGAAGHGVLVWLKGVLA